MSESMKEALIEQKANQYAEGKYKAQVESLQKSPLAKIRSITPYDVYSLGSQLATFESYSKFCAESGTAAELGTLPRVALDVITAVYGAGILPVVGSVQPIEEEQGIVYFKQLRAAAAKGNLGANDLIWSSVNQAEKFPQGFAGSRLQATIATATNATASYTVTAAAKPIRPNTIKVKVYKTTISSSVVTARELDSTIYGIDDGQGNILGKGISGTVNYSTGLFTLALTTAPTVSDSAGVQIDAEYELDYEADGSLIGEYKYVLSSKPIQAQVFALKENIGLLKSFALQKRFGKSSEDEMMNDLVNGLTEEAGGAAILSLINGARGITGNSIEWNKFSYQDWTVHKLSLLDATYEAEGKIYTNAGRGKVNVIIAGANASGWFQSMPNFKAVNNTVSGPHVVGTIGDMTIVRAPASIMDKNGIFAIYKGTGAFDTPFVWAPYMPLFASGSIPVLNNPMMKQGLVATWAGCETVVPQFVTEIKVVDKEFPTA